VARRRRELLLSSLPPLSPLHSLHSLPGLRVGLAPEAVSCALTSPAGSPAASTASVSAAAAMSDFAATDFRYRFKFQSNLVWDSIKSISNFCFQF
jgi:hypothetical protein